MLSKCANPTCSTPLIYLRDGKIFRVYHNSEQQQVRKGGNGAKAANKVEHFWLCGSCAERLTVTFDQELGIPAVVRKPETEKAVAS